MIYCSGARPRCLFWFLDMDKIMKEKGDKSKRTRSLSFDEVEDILIYFSTSILEKDKEEDIYWDLAKNVISRLGFVDCVVYKVNLKGGHLEHLAAYGPKSLDQENRYTPIPIPIGQGISGFVATTGIAERIADTRLDSRYILDGKERRSEMAVPIILKGKVIGVIDCEHPHVDFFNDQHVRILNAIASICSVKLSYLETQEVVRRKEQKLLLARQQMAELKILAIRAQMNPHFVFNALNAVQHFVTSNEKENALKFISAFGKLVRLYLKHLEHDTINLHLELDIMEQYLTLQKLRYDSLFDYAITILGDENGVIKVPSLIVQLMIEEGVENLAKNRTPGKLNIDIQVQNDEEVEVSIEIIINKNDNNSTHFEKKYANEVTHWPDHIRLLNSIKKYRITSKSSRWEADGNLHVCTQLVLPCL